MATLARKCPLQVALYSAQHRRHSRYLHPPPRSPSPWVWSCHKCSSHYRFSAALNRCLSCSHRFCRRCISEYDYDGWGKWKAYWAPSPNSDPATGNSLSLGMDRGDDYVDRNSNSDESPRKTGYWSQEICAVGEDGGWDVEWLAWSSRPPPLSPDENDDTGATVAPSRDEKPGYKQSLRETQEALESCRAEGKLVQQAEIQAMLKDIMEEYEEGDKEGGVWLSEKEATMVISTPSLSPAENRHILLFSSLDTPIVSTEYDEGEAPDFSLDPGKRRMERVAFSPRTINVDAFARTSTLLPVLDLTIANKENIPPSLPPFQPQHMHNSLSFNRTPEIIPRSDRVGTEIVNTHPGGPRYILDTILSPEHEYGEPPPVLLTHAQLPQRGEVLGGLIHEDVEDMEEVEF